jgi:tape measure domain-containing protein
VDIVADFSITGEVKLNSDPAKQSVNKWTVAAGNLIADFAKKAAESLQSVVKSGIEYNAGMENYLTNFKVMLGDEQLAAEKLEEIRRMAASTPFTLSDLTDGTQTLLQFGIAADDTTGVLKQLGDISLGNADKLQTLVLAYGKMSSAQKVTLENVNMMIDAGFNPLNQICDATGESMSDLYKRISDGKVGFDELAAAVETATSEGGQFYNGMLEASQTVNGRLSTLQDNISALIGKLTDGLFKAYGDIIGKANELVVAFLDDDEKMRQLKETIGVVTAVVTAAGAAFLSYKGYIAAASAVTAVQTVATTAMTAAHAAAKSGATGLAAAQAGLNAVLKANPIGLVVSLVAALAAGLVTAYHTSDTFRTAVNSAFASVQKIAQSAIGTVVDWINELVAKIKGAAAALANLKNGFSAAKDAYNEAYNGAMSDYNQSKLEKAAAKRKQLHDERVRQSQEEAAAAKTSAAEISSAAESAAAVTQKAAKKSSSAASKAASEVVNSITATSTQVENGVTRTTETVNETLKNGTQQQKQTVTETSRQMVNGVLSDVKTITTTAADGSQKVQQSIEAVRDVVSTTKDTQTQLVDGVKVTVEKTTELLADGSERISTVTTRTGKEIIDGVERTVKTVTTKTADGVESTVRTIEDAGPQFSSAAELLTYQFRSKLEDGWAQIQSDIQTDALGAIKTLANAIKNGDIEQLGLWAAEYFWNACSSEQKKQINDLALGALNKLSSALGGVGSNLASLASSLVAKFVPAAASATAGQTALNVAMDANPILLVISLIGMLVGALVSFASTNKDVASGFQRVWQGVEDVISVVFEGMLRFIGLSVQGFVSAVNRIIDTYNWVADKLDLPTISRVSNPLWDQADKIAAKRKENQAKRKASSEAKAAQAALDTQYAQDSGAAEKKQLEAEYAKKAAELAKAKLSSDSPGMLEAEKNVAAADYTKSLADLEKKLLDAQYKKATAELSKRTETDAAALAELEKQITEADNTIRSGDLEKELLRVNYEKTLKELEAKYQPKKDTTSSGGSGSGSTGSNKPDPAPESPAPTLPDNTGAIEDNTAAILAANEKLAEMVRQANSLVLSDNIAVSRSVAASGTAQIAAAANNYHRDGDTNITQNIYSKAQTAADLARETRWEADRAKAAKR